MAQTPAPAQRADALVLFGATGDLARKKLFPALYRLTASGRLQLPVMGVAASAWGDAQLREYAADSIREGVGDLDTATLAWLCGRLAMVSGDYRDAQTFSSLAKRLVAAGAQRPVHYLAIPPGLFAAVVEGLAAAGLHRRARVVVEKPFGRDLASAQQLGAVLGGVFAEPAIFRIDHYLGKEAVENLLGLPLRQHPAGASVEPALCGQRAGHHGRGLRGRGPRRLLRLGRRGPRRRPEPSAAGDGAAGHGGAGLGSRSTPGGGRACRSSCGPARR